MNRYGAPWTWVEEAVLEALCGLRCTDEEIARWLGRISVGAVQTRRWKLKIISIRRQWTPAHEARFRELWDDHATYEQIADELFICFSMVSRIAQRLGCTPRNGCNPRQKSRCNRGRAVELRSKGHSMREIARKLRVTRGSVAGVLHRARKASHQQQGVSV